MDPCDFPSIIQLIEKRIERIDVRRSSYNLPPFFFLFSSFLFFFLFDGWILTDLKFYFIRYQSLIRTQSKFPSQFQSSLNNQSSLRSQLPFSLKDTNLDTRWISPSICHLPRPRLTHPSPRSIAKDIMTRAVPKDVLLHGKYESCNKPIL